MFSVSNIISPIVDFLIGSMSSLGYLGIFILMAIESTIFPLPSELVLIPDGYLIYQGEMSIFPVLIAAILGSLVGSLINYYVSMSLGRKAFNKLISRYGKVFFIDQGSMEKTETFFSKYGDVTIFIGRLLPVVRHLISIPAGFAKMNIFKFSFFTMLGAGVWSLVLIGLGYFFGKNQEFIYQNLNRITFSFFTISVLVVIVFLLLRRKKYIN